MSMYYIFQSWQVEANSISHLMTKSGTRQETSFLAKLFVTGSEPSHRNSKISCQSHFSSTFGVPEKKLIFMKTQNSKCEKHFLTQKTRFFA